MELRVLRRPFLGRFSYRGTIGWDLETKAYTSGLWDKGVLPSPKSVRERTGKALDSPSLVLDTLLSQRSHSNPMATVGLGERA